MGKPDSAADPVLPVANTSVSNTANLTSSLKRARATGLDREKRQVLLGAADPVPYDRLLIACGSRPRPAPWEGSELHGIGS